VTAPTVALDRWSSQSQLADSAGTLATAIWSEVSWRDLFGSWANLATDAYAMVSQAQLEAAAGAESYVGALLAETGQDGGVAAASVNPMNLAGIASDGRSLDSLLLQPILQVADLARAGADESGAMRYGNYMLSMIAESQVQDAGRVATSVATTARAKLSGYVRQLVPPTCGRCAILAGRHYKWNAGFQRHPHCNCVNVPVSEDVAGDLTTNPDSYFGSLSSAAQDRYFGKANAQAIRDGADMGQVVNASRSMYTTTGGSRTLQATREGVTRDGLFGATEVATQLGGLRLMPEQIYLDAHGDRDLAIQLLKRFGYLI
jgi:hypothetical protein